MDTKFESNQPTGDNPVGVGNDCTEKIEIEKGLIFDTPQIPPSVFEKLPDLLCESCTLFREGIERDIFLVSAIGVLSASLPNIQGFYFNKPLSPHLFLFITGPSAAGKSGMEWAKYLGYPIHYHFRDQSKRDWDSYEIELERYNNLHKSLKQNEDRPREPERKLFFIPANSSTSSLIQTLAENDSRGIIFETESDSMAQTAKNEWGDSSDIFRKSFHHESISLARRKDKEFLEIIDPHLAIVMSGTPKQVLNIMPEVENGLFSRFLYFAFEDLGGFNSPFESHAQEDYPEYFKQKGIEVFELYKKLQNLTQPIIFKLTKKQEKQFTESFNHMLNKDRLLVGRDFDANVKRMGVITFRIAMILTTLRILENMEQVTSINEDYEDPWDPDPNKKSYQLSSHLICSDRDFETAMTIVTTLEKHAIAIFHRMPKSELKGKIATFFDQLPQQFDRQGFLKVAKELDIKEKTAENYIAKFVPKLLNHEYNQYTKITN